MTEIGNILGLVIFFFCMGMVFPVGLHMLLVSVFRRWSRVVQWIIPLLVAGYVGDMIWRSFHLKVTSMTPLFLSLGWPTLLLMLLEWEGMLFFANRAVQHPPQKTNKPPAEERNG